MRALLARLTSSEGGRTAPLARPPMGMAAIREITREGAPSRR
jgi:hypothetical protein